MIWHRVSMAFVAAGLSVSALPSSAQPLATDSQPTKGKAYDPEQVICERLNVIGSRLSVKRVCMTRAKWAEARKLDREEVERAQTQKGISGE